MAGIRTRNRLKVLAVEKVSTPGIYSDGGGLSLIVTDAGVKKWELRIAIGRRRRQLVLVSILACRWRTPGARRQRFEPEPANAAT